ncbi:MAG: hypothetical protein KKF41_14225 [Actinobacteria bacterium]|nr:hypothetical protein [Actinomycetota bacterium]MBU1942594.1 hypothetical protein [Actinomycetota bacterium]MBU2688730.1 hypothetical protein [Actinomycetota bacterium]
MKGGVVERFEEEIKEYARSRGVDIVGVAGPDRLSGPPSLDPAYTMKGARSIVSMALPMDVEAIYAFLSKETPTPHNLDQLLGNQRMRSCCEQVAGFIRSRGHRAEVVPPNNTYRRSLDVFSTRPGFSHRFGAIAAGVGAQGWSGNVMTAEHGAAVYLGTVVTEAVLESDPPLNPRHFVDGPCRSCKVCAQTCVACMFEPEGEEYVLLNGELHPRAKRNGLDLCNASCFGLHSISPERTWSTWGKHWIEDWVGRRPSGGKLALRLALMRRGGTTGDATPRYDLIRRNGALLQPRELLDRLPRPGEAMAEDRAGSNRLLMENARATGVLGVERLRDPNVLTCGHCALVCGPTVAETKRRLEALHSGGIVVPGEAPDEMVKVKDYAEALEVMGRRSHRVKRRAMRWDGLQSAWLWHRYYFGFEPRSFFGGIAYGLRLRRAVREGAPGRGLRSAAGRGDGKID